MIKALLSRTVFSHTLQCGPEWFILCSDHACFRVRLRPYQGVTWCISAPDMGHIACPNGAFCTTGKQPPYISR